ncbi:MAG: hypothetical protein EOO27_27005 [Comamonadaceae bacterium]|nr:MAG: hypothetical protein EOO27_27005 [Comamonadaceae bacterium]
MQRVGQVAQSQTSGGALGAALLPAMLEGGYFYEEPIFALSGMQYVDSIFRPKFEGWRLVGGYVPILGLEHQSAFDAVVIGASQAVIWTWDLSVPELPPYNFHDPSDLGTVSWEGITVVQRDGVLRITVLPGSSPVNGPPWWASLVCTARIGADVVGRLVLRPGFLLDAFSMPLPE